jgi:acetylornithine deacetylase/succinyl-diaminopimelate desuccinylase-like protein
MLFELFEFLHLLSRGITCFEVRVLGTQMHSSLSDRLPTVNASVKLAEVLTRMSERLQLTFTPHPLCSAPTVNLGVALSGGVNYGVYPGAAEFKVDIRTLPGMTRDQLESDITAFLNAMRREDPSLEVELAFEKPPLDWRDATEVPQDHPFVGVLLETTEQVLGWRPQVTAFPGGTDAMNFQGIGGIPTTPSFGPGWLPLAHGPNECVGVDATVDAAKIYALAARQYLSIQ